MARTRFLELLKIMAGETPLLNDSEFFRTNIDKLDTAIGMLMNHRHNGQLVAGVDAPDPPDADLNPSIDGGIAGGATVYYRVSHVDSAGNESAASNHTSINTPAPLTVPDAPLLSRQETGGNLAPGMHQYVLSAWQSSTTLETPAINPGTANLPPSGGTHQTITLELPTLPDGADGFNVYVRRPGSTTYFFLATIAAADVGDPWIDDGGTAPNAVRIYPRVDTSNAANAITVTPAGSLTAGEAWNIYRTFTEEGEDPTWTGGTLIGQVEHPATTFSDLGAAPEPQSPPEASLSLTNPDPIDLESEVTGRLQPEHGGGGFTAATTIAVDAVDGTATTVTPLTYTPGTLPNGIAPADFTGGSPVSISLIVAALTSGYFPEGMVFVVLSEIGYGAYRFTEDTDLSQPWNAWAEDFDLISGPGNFRALLLDDRYIPVVPPARPPLDAGTWTGPTAPGGGTTELAEGDVVFVPWDLHATQTLDMIRIGVETAGDPDAKIMVYLASPKTDGTGPDVIVASAELPTDATGDITELIDYTRPAGGWWLGVHNHTAGIAAATLHAYSPNAQLAPITLPPPSVATGNTGLKAAAGTTPLEDTDGLTFTAIAEAPIVQARTS